MSSQEATITPSPGEASAAAPMHHAQGELTSEAGARLFYQHWCGETPPRAILLVAHGAAEHSGRYQRLARHFTALGYAVAAIDLYGHGQSEGARCTLNRLDEYVHDMRALQRTMAEAYPEVPQVLVGHSMGGLIACVLLLSDQRHYAGCILSGPLIESSVTPANWERALLKLVAAVLPNLGVMQLDADGVSRDPEEVARYRADPLNHTGKMSARMVVELFRGMEMVQTRAAELRLPMLIMHGAADAMTAPSGSQLLYDRIGSEDKHLAIYPALYHEIFNEPERLEVFAEIERWLSRRLA